jgi:hypothetical protein
MTQTQFKEAPIFDADQHMYETPESLTKFLPEKYSRAVQYAQWATTRGGSWACRSPTRTRAAVRPPALSNA